MNLVTLGVSHHTAPVEVRERIAVGSSDAVDLLRRIRDELSIGEAVVLSTCNRTEIYLHGAAGVPDTEGVARLLDQRAGRLERPLPSYLYTRAGREAVRHLFRVVSGLDAMVVGESEIQGQVRDAYALAAEGVDGGSLTGPVLHRLFQTALATGGRVRAETRVGEGTASVAYVAVQLARKIFGTLRGRRVLLLGAGETGGLVVEALAREGVTGAVVANRTYERAEPLARRLEGRAVSLSRIAEELAGVDVVVASTAAPHPVLVPEVLASAFPDGVNRPLLMMDLAIPRDVDPDLAREPNVFLYNVDDLRQIVDDAVSRRRAALPEAERIVQEMTADFLGWYAAQGAVPVIRALRERGEGIRQEELTRLMGRLNGLPPEDRQLLEDFSRRLLNKLLHEPTTRLREGVSGPAGLDLVDAARFLYRLDGGLDSDAPSPNEQETGDHDDP